MGNYKVLYIVCLAVLSSHIRLSQSRSLNDDELQNISEKRGNMDWNTACVCFPTSVKGTPISKLLPSNDEHNRLVVYLYKNKNTGELTSYIPSLEKQNFFPDQTFDFGDKLQTVAGDGIIKLYDNAKVRESLEDTTTANIVPVENDVIVANDAEIENFITVKPDNILNVPPSDNQDKNNNGASPEESNQVVVKEIPPQEITDPIASPEEGHNTNVNLPGINLNHDLNLPVANKEQPLIGTIIEPIQNKKKSLEIHNLKEPVISDGLFQHLHPGTEAIINSPENHNSITNNNQDQKLDLTSKHQELLIDDSPYLSNNNLKVPIDTSPGFGKLVNLIPGYGVLIPPSHNSHNEISPSWIDPTNPSKHSNLVNIGYLPRKYENPRFNEWFNKQISNIRSQRPSTLNAINFQVLKLNLLKALYENGIHLSENGDLHDSNGNILKISNLKLRPILLGDPMDYDKLMMAKKCLIPYDLPYLEAMLVSLIYPPRTLAVIPLVLRNAIVSTVPSKTAQNSCSQSTCRTNVSFRSSLTENEDIDKMIDNINEEDSDKDEQKFYEPQPENEPAVPNNVESKNAYTYRASNDKPSEDLTPSNPENSDGEIMNTTSRTDLSEKEESNILRRVFNVNGVNDENAYISKISDEKEEQNEPNYVDYMAAENDIPVQASLESDSPNSKIQTRTHDPEMYGGDVIYDLLPKDIITNANFIRKSLPENEASTDDINTIIGNEDANENLYTADERSGYVGNHNKPIYYPYDWSPHNHFPGDSSLNTLVLPLHLSGSTLSGHNPIHVWTQPILGGRNGYLEERESLDDSQEIPKKLDEEDYDNLKIRIVGGNPATSSGTPVSSRGRSGYDF